MDIGATISQLAILFILLALGYAGCKLNALTPDTGKVLTKLVLNITLPSTILASVIGGNLSIDGGETAFFMLFVLFAFFIYIVVAFPIARTLSKDKGMRGLFTACIVFGNVAFMGLPVASAIFGPGAIFYIALFNVPFWIAIFSYGVLLVSGKSDSFQLKLLLNPVLIASVLVIPIALSGLRAPDIVVSALELTGSITTPASMLIIGVMLAQAPIKNVFIKWQFYLLSFVKLILLPILVWFIFRPFIANETMLGVIVVLSAMPTASLAAIFAIEYDNNPITASSTVFLTTMLSGITIPLIVFLLFI